MEFEQYERHGKMLWTRSDLKEKYIDNCICYQCRKFKPGTAYNCEIAEMLFRLNLVVSITTPVWECKEFIER